MRLKSHVSLLESTLKPVAQSRSRLIRSASTSAAYPKQIAVLGGGISGLASAHFLSKEFPKSKITIYEAKNELGGWIRSRRVDVPGGNVLFESGPRSLRPTASSRPMMQLISDLQLFPEVISTPKTSPAAQNRYIYYPDQLNLLPPPGGAYTILDFAGLLSSGVLAGTWKLLLEPLNKSRPRNINDESIGDFISRRIDPRVANNLVSAVLHGIYAGDIYQLSVKTLMPLLWQLEKQYGSVIGGLFQANLASDTEKSRKTLQTLQHPADAEIKEVMDSEFITNPAATDLQKHASTFTFKNGLQQLITRLEETLRKNPNISIKTNTNATFIPDPLGSPGVKLTTQTAPNAPKTPNPTIYDLCISTTPSKTLTPAVTVMTVNLYYRTPNLIPHRGFGYLIPRSIPFEQNPERALGVIFDHDAAPPQDHLPPNQPPGTKLTVMLGGHWWDGWAGYPSSTEGFEMAKSLLQRHLGIQAEPDAHHVTLYKNCIPQYTVGYENRLRKFDAAIKKQFGGRWRVVGTQFNGVGVNDAVMGAWRMARGCRGEGWRVERTGLERQLDGREWGIVDVD